MNFDLLKLNNKLKTWIKFHKAVKGEFLCFINVTYVYGFWRNDTCFQTNKTPFQFGLVLFDFSKILQYVKFEMFRAYYRLYISNSYCPEKSLFQR